MRIELETTPKYGTCLLVHALGVGEFRDCNFPFKQRVRNGQHQSNFLGIFSGSKKKKKKNIDVTEENREEKKEIEILRRTRRRGSTEDQEEESK